MNEMIYHHFARSTFDTFQATSICRNMQLNLHYPSFFNTKMAQPMKSTLVRSLQAGRFSFVPINKNRLWAGENWQTISCICSLLTHCKFHNLVLSRHRNPGLTWGRYPVARCGGCWHPRGRWRQTCHWWWLTCLPHSPNPSPYTCWNKTNNRHFPAHWTMA